MSSKLLVVIATGDKAKALTGHMYAKNAILRKWMMSRSSTSVHQSS